MKTMQLNRLTAALFAAVAMLTLSARGQPQDDTISYTNKFDASSDVTSWLYWYGNGSNNNAMSWDSTVDAGGGSGSLLFQTTFPSADQLAWFGTFHNRWGYDTSWTHDGTKYTNITCDIHVDPSSAISTAGTFGILQMGFYGGPNFLPNNPTIPASATNGWAHIVQQIDPTVGGMSTVSGLTFRIQSYDNYHNPVGPVKFWIDNLQMNVSPFKIPPPKLAPPTIIPVQGLNLLSSAGNGDQYQRTSLYYVNNTGVGWVGSTTPVSYALTITNFPSGLYTNYQAHIFITTGNHLPSYEPGPDYAETNVIFFDVHQNPDGSGAAFLRYKVNEYQSNTNMFGAEYLGPASAGTMGQIHTPSVYGTWGFTFNQDTNVTLFGPGGITTNIVMRPDAITNFAEPLNVLFGAQPNKYSDADPTHNVGQKVILASAGITNGTTTVVSDDFMADTSLDGTSWIRLAQDPNSVQLIPAGSAYWIQWSLPDQDFGLQTTTNVANTNSWVTLTGPDAAGPALPSYTSGGSRFVLVPSADLGPKQNFFRLLQQNYTKLQILLPGETAAPGTPTGKTGTPTAQNVGVPFDVIVNSVDNSWHVISSTDVIHITSSDTAAGLPGDAALAAGTQTFSVTLNTAGTATVTASDVTDNTKVPYNSPSVTVNP